MNGALIGSIERTGRLIGVGVDDQQPATARLRELKRLTQRADEDPAMNSRWPWMRGRAAGRAAEAHEALSHAFHEMHHSLVDDAAQRVNRRCPPHYSWQRPDAVDVEAEIQRVTGIRGPGVKSVVRALYRDHRPETNPADLALVSAHAERLPDEVWTLLGRRSYITRPNSHAHSAALYGDDPLAEVLLSDTAKLCRSVVVWRGEQPSEHDPDFGDRSRSATPGEVLTRSEIPLSTSIDPRVAARREFTNLEDFSKRRSPTDGWVLRITTDHLLYAAERERTTGNSDGLATQEREALIFAPKLRVTDISEALISVGSDLKRVQIIACEALP